MAGIRESNENVYRQRLACVWRLTKGTHYTIYEGTITDHFCIVYALDGARLHMGPYGDTDSKVEPGTTLPPFDPRGEAFRKSKIYTLTVPYSHTLPLSPHSMYVLGGEAACAG